MTVVLGVDPGGRDTGLCKITSELAVLGGCVVSRDGDDWHGYLLELRETISGLLEPELMVAIEGVAIPRGFSGGKRRFVSPDAIVGLARVFGAIEMYVASLGLNAIVVPPGGNGSGDLSSYPPQLVGPREQKAGTGILNHARSAFDCARVALESIGEAGASRV